MSRGSSKPTPPPLDDGEQIAATASDVPHAESGKATAEDAQRAAADAARAADPRVPDDAAPATAAAPSAEPEPPVLINDSGGQLVARPNPQVPIDPTAPLVLGNWFGHVKRSGETVQVHVKHGTMFSELPREVRAAISKTKGVTVGPMPPKAPPNPFTP